MDRSSGSKARTRRARWIGLGFVGAFAASVFTVIYTGLNVEGTSAEFDAGFRFVSLAPGESRTIELEFDSAAAHPEATLELTLPPMLDLATGGTRRRVSVESGSNVFAIEVEARETGRGYLVGRLEADVPVGLYRVFVTVADE